MRHALGGVGFSVLLFVGCYGDVEPSYSGALGYWTAEARARATTWHCERLADGGRACNGVVADTAYSSTRIREVSSSRSGSGGACRPVACCVTWLCSR